MVTNMEHHRQLTGHALIASVVNGNDEFVCFECVVGRILRPPHRQAALSAKSLLEAAPPDQLLFEYVFGCFLQHPTLLLVDFMLRHRLNRDRLTTLLLASLSPSLPSETACVFIFLVNRALRLTPMRIDREDRMVGSLCRVYELGSQHTKGEVVELLSFLIRQEDFKLQYEEARQVLRLVFHQLKAYGVHESSVEILRSLVVQHRNPYPLFGEEDTSSIIFSIQEIVREMFNEEAVRNETKFMNYLNAIMTFAMHDEYKHSVYKNTDVIPRLLNSYLLFDELADSDGAHDELKQTCYHAIKVFAMLTPLNVFHYSVFTPYVLRVMLNREIRDATIEDTTVIMSLAVEHSSVYDRELLQLCCSNALNVTTIDDKKALFWVKILAAIMPRNIDYDIDTVIIHCLKVIQISSKEGTPTKSSFLLQTALLLSFLRSDVDWALLRDYHRKIMAYEIVITKEFINSCVTSCLKNDMVLRFYRAPHECRSFHILFVESILKCNEFPESYSKFLCKLLGLSSRATFSISALNTLSDTPASGLISSLRKHLSSALTTGARQLVDIHIYFIAMLDVQHLVSHDLWEAIWDAGIVLSSHSSQILLCMLPNPVVVLSFDTLSRSLWKSLALKSSNGKTEFSPSIATFSILTMHMSDRLKVLENINGFFEESGMQKQSLYDYWSSCYPENCLISNLLEALLHQIEMANHLGLKEFCDLLVAVVNFGMIEFPHQCVNYIPNLFVFYPV